MQASIKQSNCAKTSSIHSAILSHSDSEL